MSLLTIFALVLQFFLVENRNLVQVFKTQQDYYYFIFQRMIDFVITGIAVLVVAIPEGLPLAVTLSLAYAVMVSYGKKGC